MFVTHIPILFEYNLGTCIVWRRTCYQLMSTNSAVSVLLMPET